MVYELPYYFKEFVCIYSDNFYYKIYTVESLYKLLFKFENEFNCPKCLSFENKLENIYHCFNVKNNFIIRKNDVNNITIVFY